MKRKKQAGKPLAVTDMELDMLALPTPQDIAEAKARAEELGSERLNAILNAEKPTDA